MKRSDMGRYLGQVHVVRNLGRGLLSWKLVLMQPVRHRYRLLESLARTPFARLLVNTTFRKSSS